MTDLITALDGPGPVLLAARLVEAGLPWVKVGPRTPVWWGDIVGRVRGARVFLDLKLSDTRETARECCRMFAERGVASVSTFTDASTRGALEGAEGSGLQVWRVVHTTDDQLPPHVDWTLPVHGIIRPVSDMLDLAAVGLHQSQPTICPGIRRWGDAVGGHIHHSTPEDARRAGAAFAVVGSPIYGALHPILEAQAFARALT